MSIKKGQLGNTNSYDHGETFPLSSGDANEQPFETPFKTMRLEWSMSESEVQIQISCPRSSCSYIPVSQKEQSAYQTKSIAIPTSESPLKNLPELDTRKSSNVSSSRRLNGTGEKDSLVSRTRESSSQHSRIPSQPEQRDNFNSGIESKPEESAEKLNVEKFEPLKKLFKDTLEQNDKKNLLTISDIQVIKEFLKMDVYHQYFLMYLFIHPRKWYRFYIFCNDIKLNQKLSSEEITEIYKSHKISMFAYRHVDLIQLGTDELISFLGSEDLRQIAYKFKIDIKCRRKVANIIHLLKRAMAETQCPLTEELLRDEALMRIGYCIKLKREVKSSFYKVYVLQTYTNFSYCEDVKNYLNDYGVLYPRYSIENYTPFRNKEQFSRFYEAVELHNEYNLLKKGENKETMKKLCDKAFQNLQSIDYNGKWRRNAPDHLQKFSSEYRYISILKDGIKEYRQKHYKDVKIWLEFLIAHYPTNHEIGFWYKHLAHIIFHNIKNYEAAAKYTVKALKFNKRANIFDIELNKIATLLITVKSYKVFPLYRDEIAAHLIVSIENRKIYIDRSDILGHETSSDGNSNDGVTSADIALKYYLDKQKYKGIFCKAKLIEILFTLLFWDVIYESYVPQTFLSISQNAPLDMYSESFYKNRKEIIDIRLEKIASGWHAEMLEHTLKYNWRYSHTKSITDLECLGKDVKKILIMFRCIDRRVLSKIFARLVTNFKRFRGGFPNLFLWNEELSKCKFVVVKTDDSQQPDTNQWKKFLIDAGAEVEDCYVSGVGAKKIKLKNKS